MRGTPTWLTAAATALVFTTSASPAVSQPTIPTISQRSFTGGSLKLVVTGSFQVDKDVPINTQASFGDGEMTWLQFGASGSAEPNSLITYSPQEVGVSVSVGKRTATAGIIPGEKSACTGKVVVTATSVTGEYTCTGVTSYDPSTGKMGNVKIEVRFTAKT